LRGGEQQCHVDRYAGEDGRFDSRKTFGGAGDLDEEIGTLCLAVQIGRCLYGGGRIVGQKWRHLQRDPAVHAAGLIVDRAKEVGSARQVCDRELEEQIFPRRAFGRLSPNGFVVGITTFERVIEDRGV